MAKNDNKIIDDEIEDDLITNDNIEEEQIYQYNIDSYTNAIPVERLIEDFEREIITVPPFQRPYVWNKKDSTSNRHRPSLFIDSVMLGLPIPPMIIYKDIDAREKGYLIDGRQRLETLVFFKRGYFGAKGLPVKDTRTKRFKLIGDDIHKEWKDFEYSEFTDDLKDIFNRRFIPVMYIRQIKKDREDTPGASSIYLLFDRLNSGGIALHPHERRGVLGIYNEKLTKLFNELLYQYDEWNHIFPKSLLDWDTKPENETKVKEYIFRLYAFLLFKDKYSNSVAKFLNNFMQNYKIKDDTIDELKEVSPKVLTILAEATKYLLSQDGGTIHLFKPNKPFNIVLLTSVFIGLYEHIKRNGSIDLNSFIQKYNKYLDTNAYVPKERGSTANSAFLEKSIEKAIEVFNG